MSLEQAKRAAETLSPEELRMLERWLHALLRRREQETEEAEAQRSEGAGAHGSTGEAAPRHPGPSVQRGSTGAARAGGRTKGISYRQEYVRCGKESCTTCVGGDGHGPYWYAYWWDAERGKTRSKYIGKEFRRISVPGE